MANQLSMVGMVAKSLANKGWRVDDVELDRGTITVLAHSPDGEQLMDSFKQAGVRKWLEGVQDVTPIMVESELSVEEWEAQYGSVDDAAVAAALVVDAVVEPAAVEAAHETQEEEVMEHISEAVKATLETYQEAQDKLYGCEMCGAVIDGPGLCEDCAVSAKAFETKAAKVAHETPKGEMKVKNMTKAQLLALVEELQRAQKPDVLAEIVQRNAAEDKAAEVTPAAVNGDVRALIESAMGSWKPAMAKDAEGNQLKDKKGKPLVEWTGDFLKIEYTNEKGEVSRREIAPQWGFEADSSGQLCVKAFDTQRNAFDIMFRLDRISRIKAVGRKTVETLPDGNVRVVPVQYRNRVKDSRVLPTSSLDGAKKAGFAPVPSQKWLRGFGGSSMVDPLTGETFYL